MDNILISYSIVAFTSLFTLVNPIGFTAIFLSMVDGMTRSEKRKIALKGVMTACVVLVVFSLIGRLVFSFFGITVDEVSGLVKDTENPDALTEYRSLKNPD